MIEIDTTKLKNELVRMETLLDEYEDIELNLFNQLNTALIDWQDGNSRTFERQVDLDRKETDLYMRSMRSKKEIFDYVYDKYRELGHRITIDLNGKTSVLGAIDACYDTVIDLERRLNQLDSSFDRTISEYAYTSKNKMRSIKANLSEMRTAVKKIYARVEDIEESVENRIKKLEEIKINDFDFSF